MPKPPRKPKDSTVNLGFEAKLWLNADKLRLLGRIYDPACGSGAMFVHLEKFVESHGGKLGDSRFYGQEGKPSTRRLRQTERALLQGAPRENKSAPSWFPRGSTMSDSIWQHKKRSI